MCVLLSALYHIFWRIFAQETLTNSESPKENGNAEILGYFDNLRGRDIGFIPST